MQDELVLFRKMQEGDWSAFNSFFESYSEQLYLYALGFVGDRAEAEDIPALMVWDDVMLEFGDAVLTLYGPLGSGDTNEEGLSLLCETENFSALITGDMDQVVEGRLVKYGHLPDIDVLLVGHHGSKYAASDLLLETVTPETAVVSCGYNTYGHPAPETLLRLSGAGCDIYRTDLQGNVTITVR